MMTPATPQSGIWADRLVRSDTTLVRLASGQGLNVSAFKSCLGLQPIARHFSLCRFILVVTVLLFASCTFYSDPSSSRHVVQSLRYWHITGRPGGTRQLRTGPISTEVEDFILKLNRKDGIQSVPKGYPASVSFAADVSAAIALMPKEARTILEKRVVGIFFARGLGSSGFSEYIYDESGKPIASFIVLDLDFLNRRANDWLTYKENLPFGNTGEYKLVGIIESNETNTRASAIQFLLFHELGHVAQVNPIPGGNHFRIYSVDWYRSKDGKFESAYEAAFSQRRSIAYYQGNRPSGTPSAEAAYNSLRHTPYPTMYGATDAGEDFAETFALYMHTVLMGKPYILWIYHNGKFVDEYNLQDEMRRLKPRFQRMAEFLDSPY